MSSILPPSPQVVPPGHAFWNVWYEKLRKIVNDLATSISWININFTGSKIEDIVSRDHNKLTTIQGGTTAEYYHLTNAEHTAIAGIGNLVLLHQILQQVLQNYTRILLHQQLNYGLMMVVR